MLNEKKSLLDLESEDARKFFLEKNSYFSQGLPSYYDIEYLLNHAKENLEKNELNNKSHLVIDNKYSNYPEINYILHVNKTMESYRPLTLIHPFLYVDLVNFITSEENWKKVKERYDELHQKISDKIICSSIPYILDENKDERHELNFWQQVEQTSIVLSLKYNYLLHTDISNYYSSIYTHTLPWAFHGEEEAKQNKINNSLIGNVLDKKFQYMNYGETVGLPQGNAVSDLMAEMLLKYIDSLLVERLENINKTLEYKILRYRDDYRIFTESKENEDLIKKELLILLQRHKLTLSEAKTKSSTDLIKHSLKEDKLFWIEHDPVIKIGMDKIYTLPKKELDQKEFEKLYYNRIYKATIQKHLYIIKLFSEKYPNSGQLIGAFKEFEERITDLSRSELEKSGTDISVLIAIITDLIRKNPKVTESGLKILSVLFEKIDTYSIFDKIFKLYIYSPTDKKKYETGYQRKFELVSNIIKKISSKSTNSYLEIWLQRLIIKNLDSESMLINEYKENCNEKLVNLCNDIIEKNKTSVVIFNEDWIKEKYRIDWNKFINRQKINQLTNIIKSEEIFVNEYSLLSKID